MYIDTMNTERNPSVQVSAPSNKAVPFEAYNSVTIFSMTDDILPSGTRSKLQFSVANSSLLGILSSRYLMSIIKDT